MNKTRALQHLGHQNLIDFICVDHGDGNGQQVVWRKESTPVPTDAEIAAAWVDRETQAGRRP